MALNFQYSRTERIWFVIIYYSGSTNVKDNVEEYANEFDLNPPPVLLTFWTMQKESGADFNRLLRVGLERENQNED